MELQNRIKGKKAVEVSLSAIFPSTTKIALLLLHWKLWMPVLAFYAHLNIENMTYQFIIINNTNTYTTILQIRRSLQNM